MVVASTNKLQLILHLLSPFCKTDCSKVFAGTSVSNVFLRLLDLNLTLVKLVKVIWDESQVSSSCPVQFFQKSVFYDVTLEPGLLFHPFSLFFSPFSLAALLLSFTCVAS